MKSRSIGSPPSIARDVPRAERLPGTGATAQRLRSHPDDFRAGKRGFETDIHGQGQLRAVLRGITSRGEYGALAVSERTCGSAQHHSNGLRSIAVIRDKE